MGLELPIWLLLEEQKQKSDMPLCPTCEFPLPDKWVLSDSEKCPCCQDSIRVVAKK